MSVSSQQVFEDLMRVLDDIDELVKAQAAKPDGPAAEEAELARKLTAIRGRIEAVKDRVAQALHRRIEGIDDYFRDNTWKTVGAAAALAFIAGVLVGRPSGSPRD